MAARALVSPAATPHSVLLGPCPSLAPCALAGRHRPLHRSNPRSSHQMTTQGHCYSLSPGADGPKEAQGFGETGKGLHRGSALAPLGGRAVAGQPGGAPGCGASPVRGWAGLSPHRRAQICSLWGVTPALGGGWGRMLLTMCPRAPGLHSSVPWFPCLKWEMPVPPC